MRVEPDKVVSIHYTLKDDTGVVVDRSPEDEPMSYVQGAGRIIPELEKALGGREPGDSFSITLEPEKGYGHRDQSLIQSVPKSAFEGLGEIETGMQFQAQTDEGPRIVTIASVQEDTVEVDGNHPLAGQTLNFDIEVADVREATDEELQRGEVEQALGH